MIISEYFCLKNDLTYDLNIKNIVCKNFKLLNFKIYTFRNIFIRTVKVQVCNYFDFQDAGL